MDNDHDAYIPAQIAVLMESAGVAKAKMPAVQLLTLAALAAACIGFGAAGDLTAMNGADPGFGPLRALAGLVFFLGLILVIVGGAEMFTSNALTVMAAADRKITAGALMRNRGPVDAGNLAGAVGLALAYRYAYLGSNGGR